MSGPPLWWLIVSGLCFLISIIFNVALIAGAVMAWKKVGPILEEVREKVHVVGDKTTSIAQTAQDTMEKVHSRTSQILGTAESTSTEVTRKVGRASAALTALFITARIVGALRGMAGHPPGRQIKAKA